MEWLLNMPLISFIEKHFSLAEVESTENIIKWFSLKRKSPCKAFYFSPSLKDSVLLKKDNSKAIQSQKS